MTKFDDIDKMIINRIQSDFPIAERPYKVIAEELGLSEEVVLDKVRNLKEAGFIRRIGGNFGPEKLGFTSTLCAAKVPSEKINEFAEVVNKYPGVTHNYLRENDFNVWFTFISPSMDEIKSNLEQIKKDTGVEEILNLPATDVFKIRAQFKL
ncbi:MAG: Lrp/AsnC family transcriptional regulator [Desulfobacterales bacterium]|nr:Lrp/AsnC family transcriptional regulator [Desulfobacterales bacterium]MCP4162566.1 Lrp/AsnC family transcriptional regulator [Deltaproteobacteria bacterium]